jgi:hypothetical protein
MMLPLPALKCSHSASFRSFPSKKLPSDERLADAGFSQYIGTKGAYGFTVPLRPTTIVAQTSIHRNWTANSFIIQDM